MSSFTELYSTADHAPGDLLTLLHNRIVHSVYYVYYTCSICVNISQPILYDINAIVPCNHKGGGEFRGEEGARNGKCLEPKIVGGGKKMIAPFYAMGFLYHFIPFSALI